LFVVASAAPWAIMKPALTAFNDPSRMRGVRV
jgi:hypothetical protein